MQISIILPLQKKWISIIWIPTPGVRFIVTSKGRDGFCGGRRQSFLPGGYDFEKVSDRVDIYNFNNGKWDTAGYLCQDVLPVLPTSGARWLLPEALLLLTLLPNVLDILNTVTDTWTVSALSEPKGFIDNATAACNKAYFVGGCNLSFQTNMEYEPHSVWISMIPIQAPGRFNT
ncbi:MAG: hypothetical protein IPL08_15215 [Saprospiraceae bacterium]|nr:hypothetical protein [Saprospiraceae bacterium]